MSVGVDKRDVRESLRGDWMLTASGRRFYPNSPSADDVDVEDIAHALSLICRFGGHCQAFYSVAQHSVLVADYCPVALAFVGLMHDASEAYCTDLVRPIKYSLPGYLTLEEKIWFAVSVKFNLPALIPEAVKHIDNRVLMTERRDLLPQTSHKWSLEDSCPAYRQKIKPWSPGRARSEFMKRFQTMRFST